MSEEKNPIELRYGYNQNNDEMDVLRNRTVPLRGIGLLVFLCAITGITYNSINMIKSRKNAAKVTAPESHSHSITNTYSFPINYSDINQSR